MPAELNSRSKKIKWALLAAIVILAIGGLIVYLMRRPSSRGNTDLAGTFARWATAIDERQCAHVSKDIYEIGGTIADATVATMLCLGVVLPESLGIGGGFLAVHFDKSSGRVQYFDARETAPAEATRDMFVDNKINSVTGAKVVAVPGELRGYRELLNMIGSNVSQAELFKPAIELARNGFRTGNHLAHAMRSKRDFLYDNPDLRKIYINPLSNDTYEEGEMIYNPELANTLERLANSSDFAQEFYVGAVGREIVEKLDSMGGILTMADLANYRVELKTPSHWKMHDNYEVYSASLPGSGPVLALMLNTLDSYNLSRFQDNSESYQRLVETFKFSYAKRSLLGDPKFVEVKELEANMQSFAYAEEIRKKIRDNETLPLAEYGGAATIPKDQGTSHANFFGPNGDVIAITSTTNFYFGSGVQVGGVILNNEMNDFSTPGEKNGFGLMPSESNYIEPLKRPMSSMVPTILVKDGEAKMAIGGAGGSQITTAAAQVLFHYFYRGLSLEESIKRRRLHHQYVPDYILYEEGFDSQIIKDLKRFGHKAKKKPEEQRGSVIVGIAREGGKIIACVDPRKGGMVTGGEF